MSSGSRLETAGSTAPLTCGCGTVIDVVDHVLGHFAELEVQTLRGLPQNLQRPRRGDLVPFHENSGGFSEGLAADEGGAQTFNPLLLIPVGAGHRESDAGQRGEEGGLGPPDHVEGGRVACRQAEGPELRVRVQWEGHDAVDAQTEGAGGKSVE